MIKVIAYLFLLLVNLAHWVGWMSVRELELHSTTFEKVGNFFFFHLMLVCSIIEIKGFYDLKILPNIQHPKNLRIYKKQTKFRILFLSVGIFYIVLGIILPSFFEKNNFFIPHNKEYALVLFANAYYILNHYRKIKF